jgi:hypothetical protein
MMSDDRQKDGTSQPPVQPDHLEERGIDALSLITAGASAVSAAAAVYSAKHQNDPPKEPPAEQPTIELPPHVDRE